MTRSGLASTLTFGTSQQPRRRMCTSGWMSPIGREFSTMKRGRISDETGAIGESPPLMKRGRISDETGAE